MTATPSGSTSSTADVDASVRGPLLVVRDVSGVGWDEFAVIRTGRTGRRDVRHGLVLEVDRDLAVVQVLEGTDGLAARSTRVAFAGEPLQVPVGPGWLGRVCNGRGEPIDGGPPVSGTAHRAGRRLPAQPGRAATRRPSRC